MNEKKINLLLVEDEQMLAEILSDTLTDKGFKALCSVTEGQTLFEKFNVSFTDFVSQCGMIGFHNVISG